MGEQMLEAAQRWQQTSKNTFSKQVTSPVRYLWPEASTNVTLFHSKVISRDTQPFTSTAQLCPTLPPKHTDAWIHSLTKMLSFPTGANHRGPMPTILSFLTVYLSESYRNKLPELFSQMKGKREEGENQRSVITGKIKPFLFTLGNYTF